MSGIANHHSQLLLLYPHELISLNAFHRSNDVRDVLLTIVALSHAPGVSLPAVLLSTPILCRPMNHVIHTQRSANSRTGLH